MKRITVVLVLVLMALAANRPRLSGQDETAAAAARQEAAAAAALERKDAASDKARQNFINGVRQQSLISLAAAENKARAAKEKENDVKFESLRQSARELMELSARTYEQIQVNGAQSVSLTVYSDLEKIDKLVKEMRKNIK